MFRNNNSCLQAGPILTSKHISLTVRGKVFDACVRSALLNGSETWAPTTPDLQRLCRNDRSMIRWICGVKPHDEISIDLLCARLGIQEICLYLKDYISSRQLYKLTDPRVVHCGRDPLGKVFGVDKFTIDEVLMTSPAMSQPGLWQQQAPDSSTANYNRFRQYNGLPEHYSRTELTPVDCRPSVPPITQGHMESYSRAEQTAVDCRPSVTPITQGHNGNYSRTEQIAVDCRPSATPMTQGQTGEVRYFISDSVDPEHPVSFNDSLLSTSLSTDPVYVPVCTINSTQEGNYGCNLVSSSNDVTAQFLQSSGYSIEQSGQAAGVVDKQQRPVAVDGSSGTAHLLSLDEHDLEQNPTLNLAINNPEIWNVFDTFDSPEKEAEEVPAKTGNKKTASKQLYATNSQTVAKADLSSKAPRPRSLASGDRKYVKRDKKSVKSGFTVTRELAMQHLKRCSCPADLEREEVPAEQVFVREGQMYRLPEANIIRLGNKELYAFIKENECFVSLALFFRLVGLKVQKLYERVVMEKLEGIQIQEMGDNEMELLRQKCQLSVLTKQKDLINLADLISLSKMVLQRDPTVKIAEILAKGQVEQKVLEASSLRCSICGLPCRKETEQANYVPLEVFEEEVQRQPEAEDPAEGEVCLTEYAVGVLVVNNDKLTAFKTEDKTYLSIKEIVKRKLLPLLKLQQKMTILGFKPVILPEEMEGHQKLNGIIMNTLWVDTVQLRCCLCLGSKKFLTFNRSIAHRICSGDYSFEPIYRVYCRNMVTAKGDIFIHDKRLEVVKEDLDRYPVNRQMKSFQIAKDVPVKLDCVFEEFSVRKQGRAGQSLAGNCVASSPDTTTDINLVCTAYNAEELKSACKNLEDLDLVCHESVASSESTYSGQAVVMPSSSTLVIDQSTEVRVSNSDSSQLVLDRDCDKENQRMPATVSVASEPETYIITDVQLSPEHLQSVDEGETISTVALPPGNTYGTCTPSSQAVDVSKGPLMCTTSAHAKEVLNVHTEGMTNLPTTAQSLSGECVVIDKDKLGKEKEEGEMLLDDIADDDEGAASPDDHNPAHTVSLSVNPQLTVDHPQSVEDSQKVKLYLSENVREESETIEDVAKNSSDANPENVAKNCSGMSQENVREESEIIEDVAKNSSDANQENVTKISSDTSQENVREIEPIVIDDPYTSDKQQEYSIDKTLPITDIEMLQKLSSDKHTTVTDKPLSQVATEVKKQTMKLKPGKYIIPDYGQRCKQVYQAVAEVKKVKKQTVKLKPGKYIMPDYRPWCNFVLDKSEPLDDGSVSVSWRLEVKEKENSQMRMDCTFIETGKSTCIETGKSTCVETWKSTCVETGKSTCVETKKRSCAETEKSTCVETGKSTCVETEKRTCAETENSTSVETGESPGGDIGPSDGPVGLSIDLDDDEQIMENVGTENADMETEDQVENEISDVKVADTREVGAKPEGRPSQPEVSDESMADPFLEQEVECTHTVISKETRVSNVIDGGSNSAQICLSPGAANKAAVEPEPRETNVEPESEKTDTSRHDVSDVSSPAHNLQTSTISYGCNYSSLSHKEGLDAHTDDAAWQEMVDPNTSHDNTSIDVECVPEENSISRPTFRSPQPSTECSESPSSPSFPATSTPITCRKSCSASRVDKWCTKIAPLNNSTSPDVSLQMLATIATAETDPESGTESDKEQDSSHGNSSVFGRAKHRPTKHRANTSVESGSFHFSLTEEKRQALEAEREALEANMKKYLVFSVSKGTPPKFSVQRFKPGAEKIFPVLFYPDPNHPSIVRKRHKFMEAAAKYLANKYVQHMQQHRPSSQDSSQKISDTQIIGKPDAITPMTVREPVEKKRLWSISAKDKAQSTVTNATTVTVGAPAGKATLRSLNTKIKTRTSCTNATTESYLDKEQSKAKSNVITPDTIGKGAEKLRSSNAKIKTLSSRIVTSAASTDTGYDKEQLKVKSPASKCTDNAEREMNKTPEKECSGELKSKRCLRTANSPVASIVNRASESVEQIDSPEHAEKADVEAGGKIESVTCDQTNKPAKADESIELTRKRNGIAIAQVESREEVTSNKSANRNNTGKHKTDERGDRIVETENQAKSRRIVTARVKQQKSTSRKVQPASPRTKKMRVELRNQVAERRHENTKIEGETVNHLCEIQEDQLIRSRKKSNSEKHDRKPRKSSDFRDSHGRFCSADKYAHYSNTELRDSSPRSSRGRETEKPDIEEADSVNHFAEIEQDRHRQRSNSGKSDNEIEQDRHRQRSNSGKPDRKSEQNNVKDHKEELRPDSSPKRVFSKEQETMTEIKEVESVNGLDLIEQDKLVKRKKLSNSGKVDRKPRKQSAQDQKPEFRESSPRISKNQETEKSDIEDVETVNRLDEIKDDKLVRNRKRSNSGKSDKKTRKKSDFRDSYGRFCSADQNTKKTENEEAESVNHLQVCEKEQDKHICRSRKDSNIGMSDRKPRKESVHDGKTELSNSTPKMTSSRSLLDKPVPDKSQNMETLEPKPQNKKTGDSPEQNTSRSASDKAILVKENASKGDKLKAEVRENLSQARKETSESSNLYKNEKSSNSKACDVTDKDVKSPKTVNYFDRDGAHVRLKKLKFLDDAVCSYYKQSSNTIQNNTEADNKTDACGTDTEVAEAEAVGKKRKAPSSAKQNPRKIRKL